MTTCFGVKELTFEFKRVRPPPGAVDDAGVEGVEEMLESEDVCMCGEGVGCGEWALGGIVGAIVGVPGGWSVGCGCAMTWACRVMTQPALAVCPPTAVPVRVHQAHHVALVVAARHAVAPFWDWASLVACLLMGDRSVSVVAARRRCRWTSGEGSWASGEHPRLSRFAAA